MRKVDVTEITKNVKEMCIEANHFLSEDMKKVFEQAVQKEKAPLGRQVLNQLKENLESGYEPHPRKSGISGFHKAIRDRYSPGLQRIRKACDRRCL